jgi:3',5'-cyclic AMP phosphodiesterase CpdA
MAPVRNMKHWSLVFLAIALLPWSLRSASGPEEDEGFSHSVGTTKKPWTKRAFRNDPNNFQFAIVTDRTGGLRPGVFPRAVKKVNELQPEFVITVGDLITGGGWLRDEQEIRRQWDEFNGFVEGFDMPFFYLPGNHDVSNDVGDRIWDELFGVRYYSFIYKDVLFLCLNTQDGAGSKPFLGQKQIAWAQEELRKQADVRWTMVFIHQPLWLTEERTKANQKAKVRKSVTGWPDMETALQGRKHTVYAGHVHRYAKYERNEVNYYTLGTTGGGSQLRGASFGEFDHATWITMTDQGPRMMNLTLDGMLEEDVATEAHQSFWRGLKFSDSFGQTYPFKEKVVTLPLVNPFKKAISGRLSWQLPSSDHWTVSPRRVAVELAPGEQREIQFTVSHRGEVATYLPLPRLNTHFHGTEGGLHISKAIYLPLNMMDHAKKHPTKAQVSVAGQPPVIDGRLDEGLWRGGQSIDRLIPRKADGYAPVKTEAWFTHDDSFLYVGVRCYEPRMRDVLSEVMTRDGEVWLDDSIEILLDANHDQKSYHHFAVNSKGVLYDGRQKDAEWSSSAQVATSVEEDAWTVEIAIPLTEIDADLASIKTWGMQMARHRPRLDKMKSYQWAPTFWYGNYVPSLFGQLEFQ